MSPVGRLSLALFPIHSARQPSSHHQHPLGHAEMRLAFLTIVIWLSQLYQATAIQKSLAGVVDWHKALIGVPRLDLEPSFQRIPALNGSDATQDVIVTATDHNILAVLDPADGNIGKCSVTTECTASDRPIVWRQKLEPEDALVDLQVAHDGQFPQ